MANFESQADFLGLVPELEQQVHKHSIANMPIPSLFFLVIFWPDTPRHPLIHEAVFEPRHKLELDFQSFCRLSVFKIKTFPSERFLFEIPIQLSTPKF
jgi:hypothetical protein